MTLFIWNDFILINIRNRCGVGNNVRKFEVSTMKIEPVARIWSSRSISEMGKYHKHFPKWNSKLINRCEIK